MRAPPTRTASLHEIGAPVWTSILEEHIKRRGPSRATAEGWIGFMSGAAEHGVSKDELTYSCVGEVLARYGSSEVLERKAVLAAVALKPAMPQLRIIMDESFRPSEEWVECAQRIEPRKYGSRGLLGHWPETRYVVRYRHRSLGWSIALVRHSDLFHAEPKWWLVLNPAGARVPEQPAYGFRSAGDAIARAMDLMRRQFIVSARPRHKPRWAQYSMQGLGEYSELLIALPGLGGRRFFYSQAHFPGVRNLLVHMRTNVCECDGGRRRVLFLDEVQSDWHARLAELRGNETGPRCVDVPDAPFAREWPLLALKFALWWAKRADLGGVAWSSPEHHEWRWRPHWDPPTAVYRHGLPEAAAKLARALSLEVSTAGLARRRLEAVGKAPKRWQVYSLTGIPTTKAFPTMEQAQRFADLTGAVDRVEVPVLWLREGLSLERMPLFGVGGAALWGDREDARRQEDRSVRT